MFKRNVGLNDRVVRIVFGLVLIAMAAVWPRTAVGWLGLYPLLTGIFGYAPEYAALKKSTVHPRKRMTYAP